MGAAVVVVGLSWGDEGKGSIVDYLVRRRRAQTVIRFNGGPQAAHNVTTSDGRRHTFAQFGAGTLAGASTILGPRMLVDPLSMMNEAAALEGLGISQPLSTVRVAADAIVVTPFHKAMNRLRELLRGDARHGSCGMGIGEARADELIGRVLRVRDILRSDLYDRLAAIQAAKYAEVETLGRELDYPSAHRRAMLDVGLLVQTVERYRAWIAQVRVVDAVDAVAEALSDGDVVFEGAQGILLDEVYGFHPYTTWTNTTSAPAHALLDAAGFGGARETLGVLRAYLTRHGAGPFPTAMAPTNLAAGDDNVTGEWQGPFRVGWPDLTLWRYALRVDPRVEALAMTCLDQWAGWAARGRVVADGYEEGPDMTEPNDPAGSILTARLLGAQPHYRRVRSDRYLDEISEALGRPISLSSFGPTAEQKCSRLTTRKTA